MVISSFFFCFLFFWVELPNETACFRLAQEDEYCSSKSEVSSSRKAFIRLGIANDIDECQDLLSANSDCSGIMMLKNTGMCGCVHEGENRCQRRTKTGVNIYQMNTDLECVEEYGKRLPGKIVYIWFCLMSTHFIFRIWVAAEVSVGGNVHIY